MYNDPANPYNDPSYSGGTTDPDEVEADAQFEPERDGYWRLIDGVWKWLTEPLGRSATVTT